LRLLVLDPCNPHTLLLPPAIRQVTRFARQTSLVSSPGSLSFVNSGE